MRFTVKDLVKKSAPARETVEVSGLPKNAKIEISSYSKKIEVINFDGKQLAPQ